MNVQFILVPCHFRLVLPHFDCFGGDTALQTPRFGFTKSTDPQSIKDKLVITENNAGPATKIFKKRRIFSKKKQAQHTVKIIKEIRLYGLNVSIKNIFENFCNKLNLQFASYFSCTLCDALLFQFFKCFYTAYVLENNFLFQTLLFCG